MKRQIWMTAALSMLAGAASASNLVVDGDFEGGYAGFNANWYLNSTYSPTNNGVSTAFGSDTGQGGSSWFAFFGDGQPITNYIDQSFATTVGDLYELTFWVAIQPDSVTDGNVHNSQQYPPQIDVGWQGSLSFQDIMFPASETYTQAYTQYNFTYQATLNNTLLEFAAVDDYNTALLLDTISVTDIGSAPEPATFALTGSALLIAGLWRRLKR
ncbi:MAG: hypothetical protein ABSF22_15135 [Bryobacteraceae bacterium]|jgi:hypothetical protein